jgi:hypothetical protein
MPVLTPAYGRDYKSAAEAEKAYLEGKDWILNDISSRWDGKPCSCRNFPNQRVELRYNKLRKVTAATYKPEALDKPA